MQIKNVFFDLDGTLTDPRIGITKSLQYALEKLGEPVPDTDALLWCIGPPLKESFARLLNTEDESLAEKAISYYRERYGEIGKYENEVYESIPETLSKLKETECRLYVVTSKPLVYAKDILHHFRLSEYFDDIYGSELGGRFNDKGDLITHILACEPVESAHCLMVGDRRHDIIGAKKNGIKSIGVTYGYGTREELAEAGADYIVNEPAEVIPIIESETL